MRGAAPLWVSDKPTGSNADVLIMSEDGKEDATLEAILMASDLLTGLENMDRATRVANYRATGGALADRRERS